MQINWHWLAVGIIPYSIKRQHAKDEQILSYKLCFGGSPFVGGVENAHGMYLFP